MKELILIRHAKAVHGFGLRDFERPLSESGKSDAALVARAAHNIFTGEKSIWCSPARRTAETAGIFRDQLQESFQPLSFIDDLYTFTCSELESLIRGCDDDTIRLIVFGHNEAITEFVNKFGTVKFDNVPTSGLVPITFNTDSWKSIDAGTTGRWIFPKQLR